MYWMPSDRKRKRLRSPDSGGNGMKQRKINAFAVLLALLLILSVSVACSDGEREPVPSETEGQTETAEEQDNSLKLVWEGTATGRIVFPFRSSACVGSAVTDLQRAVRSACGVTLKANADSLTVQSGAPMILLGDTAFADSAAAKQALPENSFSVSVSNGNVVVVASDDALYPVAVAHLLSVCSAGDGKLTVPQTYAFTSESYQSVAIFSEDDRNFRIVYDVDSADAKRAATDIRDAIQERFGFSPAVVGDNETRVGREILVGDTNRSFSKANRSYYMDYTLNVEPLTGTVALTGYLPDASKELCNMISSSDGKDFSLFPVRMGTQAADGYGSIPAYRSEPYDLMKQSDLNSYYVQYHNTTATEYSAYLEKLESLGYEQYARREVNGNLFATYTDGYNILSVNYIKFYQITRITSETTGNVTLGKQQSDLETAVTTPQLTQINGACAFLIRLSDGRFLVIDGGLNYEKNWKSIYEQLVAQNVRDGKPVIAAWILSHAHVDHYGAFIGFAEHYASKVCLESVVLNIPSYETYSRNVEAANVTPDMTDMITRAKQAISVHYSDAALIVPHAGQILWFGDAMVDMLYTHEDLSPAVMTVTNSSSLIYTVTIAGQRIAFLNDAHDDASTIVYRMYGDTLKSDMVQVAHHGYNGGNTNMYLKIAADTALWTNPYTTVIEEGLWNSPRNHFDVNSVLENLLMEDESVMILPLPHTVGSAPAYVRSFS